MPSHLACHAFKLHQTDAAHIWMAKKWIIKSIDLIEQAILFLFPGFIFSSILILLSMIWRTFLQLHYYSNSLCGTSKIESRCYVEIVVAVCCVFEFMRSKDADIVVSHLLPDRWCLHHRKGLTNPTFTNDYAMVFNFIRRSFAPTFNENRYSSTVRCINPIIAGMFNTNIGQRKLAIVQYPVRFA